MFMFIHIRGRFVYVSYILMTNNVIQICNLYVYLRFDLEEFCLWLIIQTHDNHAILSYKCIHNFHKSQKYHFELRLKHIDFRIIAYFKKFFFVEGEMLHKLTMWI